MAEKKDETKTVPEVIYTVDEYAEKSTGVRSITRYYPNSICKGRC